MKNKLLILPLLLIFLVFGCKNSLIQTDDIVTAEYGSLSIGDTTESRALKIDKILGAKVSVSGYEFNDLSRETSITDGRVSGVKIERIPVGKNRIVTVQAAKKESSIDSGDFIDGVVMRAVTDINAGGNAVDVNWSSTALGNVFYELMMLEYNISEITAEQKTSIANAIPTNVHATLVNTKAIAEDFKSGSLEDKSTYALKGATVKFDVEGTTYDNYIVQVTDPASNKNIKVQEREISGITAGTWDLVVWTDDTFKFEWYREGQITVEEDDVIELAEPLKFATPKPEIFPKNMFLEKEQEISIEFASGLGITVYYTTDGTEPTTSSLVYTEPFKFDGNTTVVKAFAVTDGNATAPSAVVTREFYKYELGSNYPDSGSYIPVDQDEWGSSADYKLGATVNGNDVEFAVYSANATKMLLEIYDTAYGEDAAYDYWMVKGSDNVWRAKVAGIGAGTLYAFRAWGPNWPYSEEWDRCNNSSAGFKSDYDSAGNRFNPNKVLFDPYAKEISHDKSNPTALGEYDGGMYGTGAENYKGAARRNFDTGKYAPKAVVVADTTSFGTKPKIPQEKAIIYEAHARGITKHPSSASLKSILSGIDGFDKVVNIPAEYQGTYKGAGMLAPYLKALGVNTIELLPVHESDNDANPDDAPGGNYWAYMTYGYFAPDRRYSSDKSYGGPTKEFKEMVAAFHEAGMEVYLDVVFNHSGEGGTWYGEKDNYNTAELTFMRGLDNSTYYSLTKDAAGYWETTGCGNNLQCDNETVRKFIKDSLTYWIDKMGVDGYRFDLAPVIGREKVGNEWVYSKSATTILDIIKLGEEKDAEMIAEAWDCQWPGGYQVGNFPDGWGEWNGRFRDALRGFVGAGNRGSTNDYINGDYNNFNDQGGPHKSVNFVVAHDGFTLADLCSYGGAGNAQNGVLTWPFGPSDGGNGDNNSLDFVNWTDENTQKASKRQAARNYIAIQMMSRGVPMIVWGDEFSRTQNGNNNPYNIDSVATWSNYNMINTKAPHKVATGGDGEYHNNFGTFNNTDNVNGNFMFMKYMLNLRAEDPTFSQTDYKVPYNFKKEDGTNDLVDGDRCVWLHIDGSTVSGGSDYLVFMNMYTDQVVYTVPKASSGKTWVRIVDTQKHFEEDFNCWDLTAINTAEIADAYGVMPWSVVILKEVAERENTSDPVMSGFNADSNGDYEGSTTVTISTSTSGADIYYTIDGSSPTLNKDGTVRNGTKYTSPFEITQTTIVKALAYKQGELPSAVVTKKFTNTAVVETPVLSVPAGDFWNTITVFVTGDTAGATYYYTTDGTEPTASSIQYDASTGIKIDANTNLKVVGIKSGLANAYAEATYTKQENKTYTENKSGVILQGFNWDSAPRGKDSNGDDYNVENPNPKWYKWYGVMQKYASEIKDRFEYVWFPPASKTDTSSSEGYAPTELNDLNSCYGTEAELKATIEKISPAKAIADIVVNHRAGTSDWGDFTNPKWNEDYSSICSDDEGFTDSASPMYGSSNKGDADTGDKYGAYRDLDHKNSQVQQGIYSWMNSVLKRVGFVGWRYDYVRGFDGKYVGYYNAMTDAAFSVGENWPDSDFVSKINNWITATGTSINGVSSKSSRAFDFVLKDKMNSAFGWFKAGGDDEKTNWDLSLLADITTLMRSNPSAAVTFVDNHDTGSTQQHWELDPGDVHVAYAYILTHPGMPCVASQHYFAEDGWQYRGAEIVPDTEFTMKQHIDYLIQIRQDVGIEYDDTVTVLDATETNYAAKIVGTKGEIVVKIGGDMWSPTGEGYDGNYPIYSGSNFAIWQKGNKGVAPAPVDLTISAPDWIWSDNAVLYAWVWGGEYGEGQWVKATGSGTTINLTIKNDAKGFLFARCSQGTTTPDWALKGGSAAGRIYNKSTDVTFVKGQTEYSVASFTEYPEIYLNPNDSWKSDGAWFAVYFFDNDAKKNEWVPMTYNNNKGLYQVVSPSSHNYPEFIFCRMKPDLPAHWDNVWNQSNNLSFDGTTYKITGWSYSGEWEN